MSAFAMLTPRRKGVGGEEHIFGRVQKQGFIYPEAERVVSVRSYHEVTIR